MKTKKNKKLNLHKIMEKIYEKLKGRYGEAIKNADYIQF